MTAPTPILAYGIRIAEAEQRAQDHDLGGRLRQTMPGDQANRINDTANGEIFAITDLVCELPAETPTDVLIQLNAAATIMEGLTSSANAIEQDKELEADCKRVLQVLASAIRVLLETPGVVPLELPREAYAQWPQLKWKGELPPVRIGAAGIGHDPAAAALGGIVCAGALAGCSAAAAAMG